jgi:hypothetical protein
MLITLALELPLRVSVTLAALLTLGLLPVAIVKARRSAAFAAMTVAMLGMLWRGEAWKTICLAEEARLMQCLQQLPKTASIYQRASLAHVDARSFLPSALIQSRTPIFADDPHTTAQSDRAGEGRSALLGRNYEPLLAAQVSNPSIGQYLWTHLCDFELLELPCRPLADYSRSSVELPYPNGSSTLRFYMTYIV